MTDSPVSSLPTSTALTGEELLYIVQSGVDSKVTTEALADFVRGPTAEAIVSRGTWNAGTSYGPYNAVLHEGSTWIYIGSVATTGNEPPDLPTTENTYWRLLAAGGTDGTASVIATRTAGGLVDLTGLDEIIVARYDASGIVAPAAYKRVASAPSHDLKFQDFTGAWFEIAETHITPGHCGATGTTYNDDNSVAVQRMIDTVRTSYNATSGQFRLTADLDGRMWKIVTSINCTNVRQAGLTLVNGGLYGTCTARAILDLSGTQGVRCNWSFHGDETSAPECAILLCRAEFPAASGFFGGAGLHDLEEVEIKGFYQGASLINYGAEVVRYPRRPVWNNLKTTGRAAMIITGDSQYLVKWMGAGAGAGGSVVASNYATLPSGAVSCINHLFTTFDIRRISSWGALPISGITKASPAVVTLTSATTKISDGNATHFHDVDGMTELNQQTYFLKKLTDTTYELYTNASLTTPLNSTAFGTFTSGNLWAGTGPALILAGGVKDIGHAHGYFLTYGGDAIVIDDQYGPNEINNVRFDFQHEATPQRSIRYVMPEDVAGVPQETNHHDHYFSFLNAAQDWSTTVIAGQRVSGTGTVRIDGLHLNIPKWGTAPSRGVFDSLTDSYFKIAQAQIRVPNISAIDAGGFGSFSGVVSDYTNNQHMVYGAARFVNGNSTWEDGTIIPAAGTTTVAPLKFQSGTNLTAAAAGVFEYDGKVFYASHAASARGVLCAEQVAILASDRTLTSTTSQQALFPSGNDALTVIAGTTYFFEALIHLSGMSATSGNFSFSVLGAGTATLNSCKWLAHGLDATAPTTAAAAGASLATSATGAGDIVTAGTGTSAAVKISGVLRVNTSGGGTIIPSVALTTATAATAAINSFFRIYPVGPHDMAAQGPWS